MMPHLFLWVSFILTLAGFFSQFGLWFDLASHFRLQYLLFQLLCIALCLLQKKKRLLIVTVIFALLNLALILPYYFPSTTSAEPTAGKPLKVVMMNVNFANTDAAAVTQYLQETSPDIFALEEINNRWITSLMPVIANYPYFKKVPREDGFGIGLYSKIPFQKVEVKVLSEVGVPSIVAEFVWEGETISLLATHPVPPVSGKYYRWRNEQLGHIASLKPTLAKNIILIGDFNTTSWTHHFQKMVKALDVRDSRIGFGLQTTWPSILPYAGITIDHCLISKNLRILERKVGHNVGSDHLPVFIKIALPDSAK